MASAAINTQQRAQLYVIGSPTGGLNGRDSLASMSETDAYQMDNIFPGTTSCVLRPGYTTYQTGLGAAVDSLEVYASGGTQTILAFAGSQVVDVSVEGTLKVLKSNLNSAQTISVMFSTTADNAQFLIVTTGQDIPMSYNNGTLTNLAFTGLNESATNLNYVNSYMDRLFWGTANKMGFYYLPPGEIQGAMAWYDLGELTTQGGYLEAIGTFSDDAGDGPNEYIVFVSSRGEYIMFQGQDPGDATNWNIIGRYRGGEPIGRKCLLDYAGDVLVLTSDGVQPFSLIRKQSNTVIITLAITSKLGDTLLRLNTNRNIWGWAMQLWPVGSMLIVNAPDSDNPAGTYSQFVMNTITQSWCRFTNLNAISFCMSERVIYFGDYNGNIYAIGGTSDNGNPISFSVKQAYNYYQTNSFKHYKWAQFLVKCEMPVLLSCSLSVDFDEAYQNNNINGTTQLGNGGQWDICKWDTCQWGYSPYTQKWVAGFANYGVVASHWLVGDMQGVSFEWYSTNHIYEPATGLL
jgi:hypothetical protein